MSNAHILGIDCGSTSAKTVIFSPTGQIMGVGRVRVPQHTSDACHVERDLAETWRLVAGTIRDALHDAGLDGRDIASVGVTAHGDGLCTLDRQGNPLGRGIMSLDSRAAPLVATWAQDGTADRAMPIIGQRPYPYSATSLLAWLRDNQPDRYQEIGSIIFFKDWIRLCLTGNIATDLTEASTALTDLHTQTYTSEILDLLGLTAISGARPEILLPTDHAGGITSAAAAATGLLEGTPVAAGLHDVTAAAVGMGNTRSGCMTITAGTFSINEVYRDKPVVGSAWSCRAAHRRGLWNCMAISPTSSSNLEWLTKLFPAAQQDGANPLEAVEERLNNNTPRHTLPLYHPFLFGSPYEAPASGAFLGLQSWHSRTDLLQSMLEGTIYNHRVHVDALATTGEISKLGISGGGSGQPAIAQLFADILGRELEIADVREAGALGAALTGAVAAGLYPDLDTAVDAQCVTKRIYRPRPDQSATMSRIFAKYLALVDAVMPHWPSLFDESSSTPVPAPGPSSVTPIHPQTDIGIAS